MGNVVKGVKESYFNCNPTYFLLKLQGLLCESDIHCTYTDEITVDLIQ